MVQVRCSLGMTYHNGSNPDCSGIRALQQVALGLVWQWLCDWSKTWEPGMCTGNCKCGHVLIRSAPGTVVHVPQNLYPFLKSAEKGIVWNCNDELPSLQNRVLRVAALLHTVWAEVSLHCLHECFHQLW